ncbi:cupin-like domain-containing protein [Bradyrhizobium lablabi]|uniref:cupin-like domain-containing protein n=1 Tax=Bradyrhizobium lablabi TaxID=722472 RepID=UPI001BAA6016|nr:cupin-like domain-containing protein [Bradyrhizobium lablabi]MBR0696883.1 cupin-like domain-containing protein [Bradyrhizobium lablabi]
MTTGKIFTNWDDSHSELWSHQPIRLEHSMHRQPAFSMDDLARLIETYPREHYSLVKTGAKGSSRVWREGEIGKLSGRQVIGAISRGGLWLNLRNVTSIDRRYRDMIDQMFAEVAAKVPDFEAPTHQAGILISSPDAQVYYHADLPGQGLIQIAGRKRVYIYPNTAPFIRPEHLEDIALFDVEVDIPYATWYDKHAQVIDLEPGQMLNWPLNAPHRVENLGSVNISMTVSYVNEDIRRAQILHLANGMLRHRFGYAPRSRSLRGPSFFAKQVMQKLLRDGKWVKRERAVRRPVDFRLDATDLGKIVDLPKAA